MTATVAGLTAAIATGNLWMLAVVYIIPERIAMFSWRGGLTGCRTTGWRTRSATTATGRPAPGWGWSGCSRR